MLSLHSQFKAALHVKAGWQRKVANGGSIRHRSHRRRMREKSWRICRCTAEGEANEGPKFSQKVVEGGKEVRRNLKWSKATVTENKAASLDGHIRILVLSIEDPVEFLDGRKLKEIQNSPRWIDDFEVPGMFIGVRGVEKEGKTGVENGAERLLPITSSPNQARMDSALLDAALVEVMVDRSKDEEGVGIGYKAPGDVFEVTQALGRGFSSLFSTYVGLLSALEEKRELLMVGYGANGIGSLRSALNWNPVMALATDQRMSFVLVAPGMTSAACIPEWDIWRGNGVKVVPVYERPGDEELAEGEASLESLLADNMFSPPERFNDLVKYPMECAVLMAGLPGSASTFLTKKLSEHGVSKERFLFCEFF